MFQKNAFLINNANFHSDAEHEAMRLLDISMHACTIFYPSNILDLLSLLRLYLTSEKNVFGETRSTFFDRKHLKKISELFFKFVALRYLRTFE